MRQHIQATALAAAMLGISGAANAGAGFADLEDAVADGRAHLDLRLRHEHVEQDDIDDEADALTLRARLGYTTQAWNALTAFVEMESVSALVDDYAPENAGYPVVADPDGAEVNQYGLRYEGVPHLTATLGRSRLILDNARWVGNVGWRQNEQTFDGAFLKYNVNEAVTAQYAWLGNVNTVTQTNADLDGHLLNLRWAALPQLALTGYAYLLDYEGAAATDFDTWGVRAAGSMKLNDAAHLVYAAEFARQSADAAGSSFDANYLLGELGVAFAAVTVSAGYEVLGSDDGAFGLQTPLATKHAFQGWADVFLTTPTTGIRDIGIVVAGKVGDIDLQAAWHQFSADDATPTLDDYGSEIDFSAGMTLVGKLGGLLKFASYSADDFGTDTDKLWLQLEYKL